ncbi:hypothetical protein V1511DRAFT_485046 [Dipodascopsis uninucleata]
MASATAVSTTEPCYATYQSPRSVPTLLSRQELLQWFQTGKKPGYDFILVHLRGADFRLGTIQGSLNLQAQSLYGILPTFYALVAKAQMKDVVWYCGMVSSRGRGTRAAGWFADLLEDQGESSMRSWVLEGGIKGWATGGKDYTERMCEYDISVWES